MLYVMLLVCTTPDTTIQIVIFNQHEQFVFILCALCVYTCIFGNWCDFQVKWINLVQWENEQEISIHGMIFRWFEKIEFTLLYFNSEQFAVLTRTLFALKKIWNL